MPQVSVSCLFSTFATTKKSLKRMKNVIKALFISIITITSCNRTSDVSQKISFDIDGNDGQSYSASIYLPAGWSSDTPTPAVFIEDGMDFDNPRNWALMDSLYLHNAIGPVAIACLNGNRIMPDRTDIFINSFIPYVQKKWNTGLTADSRICFGTGSSADRCLELSMGNNTMFEEYWCFSPSEADLSEYGLLQEPVNYLICWGSKEEAENPDHYSGLLNCIRKRGGNVRSWKYDGGMEKGCWYYWFFHELMRRFPAQDSSLK